MALECGMTPTQFWEDEPRLINSYIRKHELELDESNYKSWLIGLYSYEAVSVALSKAFSDKGKADNINYFEKPIEELFSNYEEHKEQTSKDFRKSVNYWAKFAKKGGNNKK